MRRLDVAFIWHMHQPYYKDDLTGRYLLPWVRLHGVKDYFPMAALLENFENVKATFNLVPVLVEQLNDYAENNASDIFLELTLKKASGLVPDERLELLGNFFRVNFKRFIEPNARFSELLIKRGLNLSGAALKEAARNFSGQDLLDLQVLFNLSWFHSISIDDDANLKNLIEKNRSYTEEDKRYVVFKQREILKKILPLYKRLQDSGRIEITTTPYYHPILPLICDTQAAKVSSPAIKLPKRRFAHPEDAGWHIEEAIKYHTSEFGRAPRGMWPSEGSLSDEALDLVMSKGLDWVAADENILFKSLALYDRRYKDSSRFDRRLIYEPYRLKRGSRHINMVFRDKNLSDMISFNYNSWPQAKAAEDLVGHFRMVLENLRRDADRGLLTIVMDGENAWEYYEDNARLFFETVYSKLAQKEAPLKSTTVSEYLAAEPPKKTLTSVSPGSWINHNFEIWIGDEQDNLSWEYLARSRRDLVKFTDEVHRKPGLDGSNIQRAWRELYIAEGSDWNWWYGGRRSSGGDNPFDKLYRMHLKNIYKLLKKPIPDFLNISIA